MIHEGRYIVGNDKDIQRPAYLESTTTWLDLSTLGRRGRERTTHWDQRGDVGDVYKRLFAKRADQVVTPPPAKSDIMADDTWRRLEDGYDPSQIAALRASLRKKKLNRFGAKLEILKLFVQVNVIKCL